MVQTSNEQAVAKVVRKQVSEMIDGDIKGLRQIILPKAELVHITGTVQTRNEWLTSGVQARSLCPIISGRTQQYIWKQ
ncbi:nuclear transport factor 2 family protein [Limosilactobacillus reuteri]|uniref:nuclear transport factor 2 family protein n=1 Tax=Limosilactobacillus reuteri TaxID=1598 RepID=UPI001E3B2367|nr:nuclear transport factor 2 family protein [Limosilactobacillus reuteri]MCC4383002.1 nuclear transport factor 2 family protein [Limosilactobacillus reuteri]MCC4399855.1 nuclear transport factor 2 family protein [Limosilactobacillus reuteri]MCC4403094.1 nuclear transport factor 2 family protein [Limosilactobacillus reuteri]MCC4419140.1 nuclear transport factor 2 family protein [Limosilactobacillus reuteri]MCC4422235.1 nuclear transport factor 2 family protein [Limosilactobacillus reuteri]